MSATYVETITNLNVRKLLGLGIYAVADLPVAAVGNKGNMVFTTDGGPGGAPGVVVSDGSTWTAYTGVTGTFTTLTASSTLGVTGAASFGSTVAVTGATTLSGGVLAAGAVSNDFSGSTGTFKTSTGANTLGGAVTVNAATTPSVTTAAGKTNTGFVQINGKTSGALKLITADATAQTITVTGAAQTVGGTTLTIPDFASVSDTFVFTTLAQSLASKTLVSPVVSTGLTASGASANTFAGSTGTFITSTGLNTLSGKVAVKTIATPVAATGAGGGVGGAAALGSANVVAVSSDGATKGVKLLTGVAGDVIHVINTSSTACNLFAASGGTINGGAANAGCAIPASKGVLAVCTAADTWIVSDFTARAGAAA